MMLRLVSLLLLLFGFAKFVCFRFDDFLSRSEIGVFATQFQRSNEKEKYIVVDDEPQKRAQNTKLELIFSPLNFIKKQRLRFRFVLRLGWCAVRTM